MDARCIIQRFCLYIKCIRKIIKDIIILNMQRLSKVCTHMSYKQRQELQKMKQLLSEGLFSIQPVCKNLTKPHLRLLSTPGVAEVCGAVQEDLTKINQLSIRGRSIAIVSRGKLQDAHPKFILPMMDWLVAQIKFYSNINCFPFVIRPNAPLADVLSDLANTFSGVLYLDDQSIPIISHPLNFFVLNHRDVCMLYDCQFTDAQASSYVLARLIKNQAIGNTSNSLIQQYLFFGPSRIDDPPIMEIGLENLQAENLTSLQIHKILQGKISVEINFCDIIQIKKYFSWRNFQALFKETQQQKCVTSKLNAILTDGTAILGLGNIGPIPGLPVMQAKSMMFKKMGGVDVVPICINRRKTPEQAIEAILDLIYLYRALNLQDFRSPECFIIERTLYAMDILPVFHDDQHGTAIATLSGFINASKLIGKRTEKCKVVINGAGAAGLNIARILYEYGVRDLIIGDTAGLIYQGRKENMNPYKAQISAITNPDTTKGFLPDALVGADFFIGASTKDTFKKEWIELMNDKPVIFALANPYPEINREDALDGGCYIYASGRSDRPNQISNSLAYPGIFKAINEHGIRQITYQMKIQAAQQIANLVGQKLSTVQILPTCLNKKISKRISTRLSMNQ